MDESRVQIEFENVTLGEADQLAGELEQLLREVSPGVDINRRRPDPSAMSVGSVLVLVLGTPAAVVLARAIGDWLRRTGTRIRITKDGEVLGENLASGDMPKLVAALGKRQQ